MAQEIASLEINITNNATNASRSINSLAKALEALNKVDISKQAENISSSIERLSHSTEGLAGLSRALTTLGGSAANLLTIMDGIVRRFSALNGMVIRPTVQEPNIVRSSEDTGRTATSDTANATSEMVTNTQQVTQAAVRCREAWSRLQLVVGAVVRTVRSLGAGIRALPFGNLVSQFMRLFKMKILRSIITTIMKGMSEGLQNAYYWARLTGNQFADSMDTIATSLNYAKNSIGAAFAGLLNTLAPVIDRIVDWLVDAINYANMFFAALSGSNTYIKAKKNAVAWGDATASAANNGTAAVKELEETLSVLDFDELNQLSDQASSSSGGGGGSGGGASTDYGDMFEEATISNALQEKVTWLKENWDWIFETVKAIGVAILAWKFSSAFLGGISSLSLAQKAGIALMITGVALSYSGGYDLAFADTDREKLIAGIKSAIGAALGLAGSLLTFGTGPVGWVVGIGISVTAFIVGFTMGNMESIKQELTETSEAYQMAQQNITTNAELMNTALERIQEIKTSVWETTEEFSKIQLGKYLLDQIESYEGKVGLTLSEQQTLAGLIEQYNNLELGDIVEAWGGVNEAVGTNVDKVRESLDLYEKAIQKQIALNKLTEIGTQIAEIDYELQQVEENKEVTQQTLDEKLADYNNTYPSGSSNSFLGLVGKFAANWIGAGDLYSDYTETDWKPGDEVDPLYATLHKDQATRQMEINALMEDINQSDATEAALQENKAQALESQQYWEDYANGAIGASERVKSETKGMISAAHASTSEGAKGIVKSVKEAVTSTANTISDGTKGWLSSLFTFSDKSQDVVAETGSKLSVVVDHDMSGIVKNADSTLSNTGKGVNYTGISNTVSSGIQRINGFLFGSNVASSVEQGIETTGNTLNVVGIASKVRNFLAEAFGRENFSSIGKNAENDVELGMTNGTNETTTSGNIFTKIKNALNSQLWSSSGRSATSDIESGMTSEADNNSYSVASAIFQKYKSVFGSQYWSGIGAAAGKDIANGITSNVGGTFTYTYKDQNGNAKQYTFHIDGVYQYATGGFPNVGDLFIANEAGAEMIGTVGGKTAVANNEQIASAIAKALNPILNGSGNGRTETTNIALYLDNRVVARAAARGQKAMNKQFNLTATS